jgi:nickel-dependent lactate racemase
LEEEAKCLKLKGNPVHECMEEAVEFIDNEVFCINMVLDTHRNVHACSSGNIFKSFYEAKKWSEHVYCVPTPPCDIVLAVAPHPMDVNLYQSQKAIESGKLALNDEGILILVSQCRDGIGPDKFHNLLTKCKTPTEVLQTLKKEYKLGYQKAGKIAELATKASIWAVTTLEPVLLQNIFMKPYASLQKAVDDAVELKSGGILVLPEAGNVVPFCE